MKKKGSSKGINQQPNAPKAMEGKSKMTKKFPVVGIGASAGGLEALEQFFSNLPTNTGMAFVVIQHLDPNHKGMMSELIQRMTKMNVCTVTDRLSIKPDHVYIIPSNKNMSVLNGALYLFDPIEIRGLRLPIDFFLRSLADDLQDQSIAIILSGMGSDGSAGIKAIKEKAGIVLVQEPSSAKFESMPHNAIQSCVVDIVAPSDELPEKLITILNGTKQISLNEKSGKDLSSLEKIVILLRSQTGNDFSKYKKNTVYRRIERRMSVHQIGKIALYVRYLQENPVEVEILFKELLIGVTSFFRDPELWEQMKSKVLPALCEEMPDGHTLRAWIPGCSTGEEAYSLAIVFKDLVEKLYPDRNLCLQIFASDLDTNAINIARKGIFPSNIISDVSADRLKRYFDKSKNHYRIKPKIREMMVFAPQNVIKDPPFTKLDIVSCRNLLIYLEPELQKKLLTLFNYCLKPKGVLILGNSETNSTQNELFSTLNAKLRIYQNTGAPLSVAPLDFPSTFFHAKTESPKNTSMSKVPDNIQQLTDDLLLQKFSPASVLVNNKGDILYITGSTGKYLAPAAGKANMNLFAMAREGLSNELLMGFRSAMQSFELTIIQNIKIGTNGGTQLIDLHIQQIEKPLALKGKILVIFKDIKGRKPITSRSKSLKTAANQAQAELENELQRIREELQSTLEEMQTSQEELKSTNEELQSTNEELQSTNEELTTSKEEMQSMNEELHTVNAELQEKIDDFARVNNDMSNLLNSIEIATIFLDHDYNIRQFTESTTKIFKLIPSDIGRRLTDLVSDLDYPEIYEDAKVVLRTLMFIEKVVPTRDNRWFTIRMMPYRTSEDKIDGLVITFIDITETKNAKDALLRTQRMQASLIQNTSEVIIGLSSEGTVKEFNPAAEKLLAYKKVDVLEQSFVDLFVPEASRKKVKEDMAQLISAHTLTTYKTTVRTSTNQLLTIEWSFHKLIDNDVKSTEIIAIGMNIATP